MAMENKWACPKCGATTNVCGKRPTEMCTGKAPSETDCSGLICECDQFETGALHGESHSDPCEEANCYHCGWGGRLPVKPKGLAPWEKKALEAGWKPPPDRF